MAAPVRDRSPHRKHAAGKAIKQETCLICFDKSKYGVTATGCEEGGEKHFVCRGCLAQYVTFVLDATDESDRRLEVHRKLGGLMRCPHHASGETRGCGGTLPHARLKKELPRELFVRYCASKRAAEEHRQWEETNRNSQDPAVLRECLLREMPNAKQCRRCHYGPIDTYGCNNLNTHHGDKSWVRTQSGHWSQASIRNQCPTCGWWASRSQEWPAWDGTLHFDDACRPCSSSK